MNFLEALNARHACKIFDSSKEISAENKKLILEFARLSPSSFGLEPWKFLVVSNKDLREKIKPTCWNQNQITTSSFIVICLSYQPHHFRGKTPFLEQRVGRLSSGDAMNGYINLVTSFLAAHNTQEWAKRQAYLAMSNMMSGAATLGIDSCPMEGFEQEKLKPVLEKYVDWNEFDPTAVIAFGYKLNETPKKVRESSESVIQYID